jgi:hypothetical protein
VEAVRRGEYLFLISHLDRPVEVELGSKRLDLLTWAMVGPRAVLAPRDALVLSGIPDGGPQLADHATGSRLTPRWKFDRRNDGSPA